MDARSAAAMIIKQVIGDGRSLVSVNPTELGKLPDTRERRLAQELVYGVLRWFFQLHYILKPLLKRPLRPKDGDIYALLLIGLYQLIHLRTPTHAAVASTVGATRTLGKYWATGLVNAVLRRYLRERPRLMAAAMACESAACAHPAWLVDELRQAWPEDWPSIVEQNNRRAPMALRVNAQKMTRDAYLRTLTAAGLKGRAAPHTSHGVVLSRPVDVPLLPGFEQGQVSIQDPGAQLAAPLLELEPGQRVLDACAAPGGKTAHILESAMHSDCVMALERDPQRIKLVKNTLARLQLQAKVVHGDASRPQAWWDGKPFHRILADVPCSSTGVIRRHPDIKVLRRPTDIAQLVYQQQRLLDELWPLLARQGRLLYSTCSILPRENQEQIKLFLARHRNARLTTVDGLWGRDTRAGHQILPGEAAMDGFFYACLVKI